MLASRLYVLIASTVIAAIGAGVILLLADRIESYYVIPFLIGILCLPMIALSDVVQGISRANSWATMGCPRPTSGPGYRTRADRRSSRRSSRPWVSRATRWA